MPIQFSQDTNQLRLRASVTDANGNLITVPDPTWHTDTSWIILIETDEGGMLATFEHATRQQIGSSQIKFEAGGGIQKTIDVVITPGAGTNVNIEVVP